MSAPRWYVYIVTNKPVGVLYIGMTGNLAQRMQQHKAGEVAGFTAKYKCRQLVYVETYYRPSDAIAREKALKNWKRPWKIEAIERENPTWEDLSADIHMH